MFKYILARWALLLKEYMWSVATWHNNNFTEFKHTGYKHTNALSVIFIVEDYFHFQ
jgi:hypothetical protein